MDKVIKSKALEVNLNQTKNVEYSIPEKHLLVLSLSENYWGIHKRAEEFFKELHHPYSNRKEVINLLGNFSIGDFWVYKELKEIKEVTDIILDIYDSLFAEKLPEEITRHLLFIYLDFFSENYYTLSEFDSIPKKYLNILNKNLDNNLFSYLSNIEYFKRNLDKAAENEKTYEAVFIFMKRLVEENIKFWETTTNIEKWYKDVKDKMSYDYSDIIKSLGSKYFNSWKKAAAIADSWDELNETIYTFSGITDLFRQKIKDFKSATDQFLFIFYMLHLPGAANQRDYLLLDLNKVIKRISTEMDEEQSIRSIDELFVLFSDLKQSHINYILDSILTLGKEIINTKNERLIHYLENQIIRYGFITPGIAYLTDEWELKVDPNHIKNIRIWLELIEYDPEIMKMLLSALIINLRIGGIFIFDTDLFQKDITKLLNSNISPIYKQIKQLTRIFPVYFNEIGAEGLLRDVSTRLDEISHRNDKLIHFLRKQIHTEGNNTHINITIEIIKFWFDLKKERLKKIVPQNVYDTIETEGIWTDGVHNVLEKACRSISCTLPELLEKDKESISDLLTNIEHDNKDDNSRVSLIIELYQLLKEKYLFEVDDIAAVLRHYHFFDVKDIEKLESSLENKDNVNALKLIFSFMVRLNEIIFNPEISEGWESIFYKRHIAFGIPSMYGQYREAKFEAMGLTFRLEGIASVIVSNIISEINTDYFTGKTLKDIYSVIQLLREGLSLDGIYDQGFDSNLKMFQYSLTSGSFTIRQYINIFQFMETSVKEIINKYFIQPYERLLNIIIPQYLVHGKSDAEDNHRKVVVQKSEVFYRELLSSAFLVHSVDNFIGRTLSNLRKQITDLSDPEIQSLMTYDPDLVLSPIYRETPVIDNQVFLGSKGYFLKKLYLNKFPVPPGFVITTEIFRRINSILKIPSLNNEIDSLVNKHITELENLTGLKYGDPEKPLLLSVRSGAAISMPGVMSTFLNVGLNDEITENLSKQYNYGWTSWDCYRRLLQTWGMSYGIGRNDFDEIMIDYKQKYNIVQKSGFSPDMMKEISFAYKKLLSDNGIPFETDPHMQVRKAIISVFNSWNTPRAKVYREHMQIAEEWGTAVIVQQMILGNIHKESGSGVLFTHDAQDNLSVINLTGDFSFLTQGEDIVAGLVNTLPVSENQRQKYYSNSPFSLESAFPKIYHKLKEIAHDLIETHGFGHQEIEFTFETSEPEDLYILQTRDMAILKQDTIEIFASPEKKMKRVGSGIGIGKKVLNGVVVFDIEDLLQLKNNDPDKKAILVRPDTVPDDIEIIFECEGLLTAKGGATSHAAVTAATLGKTGVVGCHDMIVFEKEKKCIINGNLFHSFDLIAIDGNKGVIYKGNYPVKIQAL